MIIALLIQSTLQLTVPVLPQIPVMNSLSPIPAPISPQYVSSQLYPIPSLSTPFCILGSNPVCGADDQTYPNPCILLLLGVSKKSDGWCPEPVITTTVTTISYKTPNNGYLTVNQSSDPNEPCACNSVYNPVCGSNGVTYASRCRLECSNVNINHSGPCNYFNWAESPHFNCPCPYEFEPVCAGDGATYENQCAMRCAHQSIKSEGACQNPCNCTNTYKPLCAQNGKTYRNLCLLKCDKQEVFSSGKCPDRKPSRCSYCEGIVNPVCSTNGLTYENHCYMRCSGSSIYSLGICPNDVAYDNSLSPSSRPLCNTCRPVVLPVCGADKHSYQNACMARCKGIKIQYRGKCLTENRESTNKLRFGCRCSNEVKPVCGVDGRTYQNACFANCFKIRVHYQTTCRPENPSYCFQLCKNFKGPIVCGKNMISYHNECIMTGCMRIPLFQSKPCDALNSSNHPGQFSYNLVQKSPRAMSNQKPVQPQPVFNRPQTQVVRANPQISAPVNIYPKSGSSLNLKEINLNDKNSVIKVYKLLFPNGRALNNDIMKYKSVLEAILYNRFKINPTSLF
jgi:coxsackievirus/adenovirus receptor